jgi:hypothetical protein
MGSVQIQSKIEVPINSRRIMQNVTGVARHLPMAIPAGETFSLALLRRRRQCTWSVLSADQTHQ